MSDKITFKEGFKFELGRWAARSLISLTIFVVFVGMLATIGMCSK